MPFYANAIHIVRIILEDMSVILNRGELSFLSVVQLRTLLSSKMFNLLRRSSKLFCSWGGGRTMIGGGLKTTILTSVPILCHFSDSPLSRSFATYTATVFPGIRVHFVD